MGNLKLGLLMSSTDSFSYHYLWTINEEDWEHSCGDMRTTIKEL